MRWIASLLLASLLASGAAAQEPRELELSPAPPGFQVVEERDGSIVYSGESQLRRRLEQRGTRILVLRHGQSKSNADSETVGQPLLYGQSESPLTELGQRQALQASQLLLERLGGETWLEQARLSPEQLPIFVCSSLERARETSSIVAEQLRSRTGFLPQVVVDGRLAETHFGRFEGHPLGDVAKSYPDFLNHWRPPEGRGTDYAHRFPGGESRCDVMLRVASLLEDIADRYPGRTVILVSHSECLLAVRAVLGLAPVEAGKLRAETSAIGNANPTWWLGP